VHSERNDVEYLLEIVNQYFPGAEIKEEDILGSYAGVRPLVADGSDSESKTSREHIIMQDPRNVTFVAGGKYTTYRLMAEATVDSVLTSFSFEERARFSTSDTKNPLNPNATVDSPMICEAYLDEWAEQYDVCKEIVVSLAERHGEETPDILSLKNELPKTDHLLWRLELQQAMRTTMCMDLVSFYLRRTPLFLSRKDHGFEFREPLAEQMASYYNWNENQKNQELQKLEKHLRHEMGWLNA
jgi:glycerol-3-phosphate dehydrogenase